MQDLASIIQDCKKQNPSAQKQLYQQYKDILYPICLRYVKNTAEAEDVFIEGFYKIFSCIDQYQNVGSFEGWMKRIMVNETSYLSMTMNINCLIPCMTKIFGMRPMRSMTS
jgi:DNA-directed RNA polymerase specialized sigma24 family protein